MAGLLGCGSGTSVEYQTLLADDFSTFPYDWVFDGYDFDPAPDFGFPAPSGFIRGRAQMSPSNMFEYSDQAIDVRVTAFMRAHNVFGEQFATLKMSDNAGLDGSAVGYVAYHLVNNIAQDMPRIGYPPGPSAEVWCTLEGGSRTIVDVPYAEGSTAFELFFRVDANGSACGYDDTVIASDALTSVTGTYRVVIAATLGTDAWFDNLIVRRAD